MARTVRSLSIASIALALAACERQEVLLEPSSIAAFEGERTVVRVRAALGCPDVEAPVLEAADGAALAGAFSAEAREHPRRDEGEYYIGNPGRDRDIILPDGDGADSPVDTGDPALARQVRIATRSTWTIETATRRFDLLLLPALAGVENLGAGPGQHRLRVRVRGCGTEASADLTVDVRGRVDLGAFCGLTTGATCADDGGCERAGSGGELCAAAGTREAAALAEASLVVGGLPGAPSHASACTDPVPSGATCGCVSGACTWRLP